MTIDVENVLPFFADLSGKPLQGGQIYFGVAGQNPVTNQIAVYWDAAATQPVAQPVSVANGLTMRSGTPSRVYVPSAYSRLVLDSTGRQVSFDASLAAPLRSDLAVSTGASIIGWIQAGVGAVLRLVRDKLRDIVDPRDFGATIDGTTDNTAQVAQMVTAAGVSPLLLPPHTVYTTDLTGMPRVRTTFSEPEETDHIGYWANQLHLGNAVEVDCYGDSTMWGDNGGTGVQSPTTQPSRLHSVLSSFYGTGAITVNNKGISGSDSQQFLDGTDGSGQTARARIAATTAGVIYWNHCINDVNVGRSAKVFKANQIKIVKLCRRYGKTPIMVTPSPMLVTGNATFDVNAETLRKFVGVMRQVAAEFAVPLVDQYDLVTRFLRSGDVKTNDLFPDSEHPNETLYKQMGQNLALPWIGQYAIPDARGFLPAALPAFQSTSTPGSSGINLPYSRIGNGRWTDGGAVSNTIRACIFVPEAGMDLYAAQMLWDEGSTLGAILVDYVSAGNVSYRQEPHWTAPFSNDYEVCIARNLAPGLHYIQFENGGAGRIGINYLRLRETSTIKTYKGTGNAATAIPAGTRFVKVMDQCDLNPASGADSAILLFDDLPAPGLFEVHNVQFNAQLYANQYLVMRGCINSAVQVNTGEGNAIPHIVCGLDTSGFLTVIQFLTTTIVVTNFSGATDYRGAAHDFRFQLFNGNLDGYVDGVKVGPTIVLQQPNLKGGHVGLYTFNTLQPLIINNMYFVKTL